MDRKNIRSLFVPKKSPEKRTKKDLKIATDTVPAKKTKKDLEIATDMVPEIQTKMDLEIANDAFTEKQTKKDLEIVTDVVPEKQTKKDLEIATSMVPEKQTKQDHGIVTDTGPEKQTMKDLEIATDTVPDNNNIKDLGIATNIVPEINTKIAPKANKACDKTKFLHYEQKICQMYQAYKVLSGKLQIVASEDAAKREEIKKLEKRCELNKTAIQENEILHAKVKQLESELEKQRTLQDDRDRRLHTKMKQFNCELEKKMTVQDERDKSLQEETRRSCFLQSCLTGVKSGIIFGLSVGLVVMTTAAYDIYAVSTDSHPSSMNTTTPC